MSRAETMIADLLEEVARMRRDKERLEEEVRRLGDVNNEQCDHIFELQQMLSRATEEVE